MSSTHSGEIKNDEGNPIPVSGTVTVVPSGVQDVNIVSTIPVPVTDNGGSLTVDAVSWPLPTGAATEAKQTQPGVDIGDVTVNNGSGVAAVNIQDGGNSITVDGPLTDTQLRATPVPISGTVTITDGSGPVTVDGTVAATQSGTWTTARSWTLSTATDSISVNPVVSSSVSVTRVATSTTPNTIAANASRKQLMIDTEAGIHYVLLGAGTVSSTNYSVQLTANSYYEVPAMWTGVVSLVKSTGTGNAQITEIS